MFGTMTRIVAGLGLFAVVGCGAPSSYDNCNAACDAQLRCNYGTQVDHQNCVNKCNDNKGSLADFDNSQAKKCSNESSILSKTHDCYASTPCLANLAIYSAQILSCLSTATQCVTQ